MPELRRYLTRANEVLVRHRGSIDQLCAGRQQLSPHRHLQDLFMAAMRESLCWHLGRDTALASACLAQGVQPNQLRRYEDLLGLPQLPGKAHGDQQRDVRRWAKVVDNSLDDLGWSRSRRRYLRDRQPQLRCSAGHWHLPRVVRWQGGRLFSPVSKGCSRLCWPTEGPFGQGLCACGREGQWSAHQGVWPL